MSLYLKHTATIKLLIPRHVVCEHCQFEYIYEMKRTALGVADSGLLIGRRSAKEKASRQATEDAEYIAKVGCSPVPCPNCYLYQRHMYEEAGQRKWGDLSVLMMLFAFLAFGAIGLLIFFNSFSDDKQPKHGDDSTRKANLGFLIAFGIASSLAISTYFLQRILIRRHNPNLASLNTRESIAKSKAMTLDQFANLQSERTKTAYGEVLARNVRRGKKSSDPEKLFLFDRWIRKADMNGENIPIELPSGEVGYLNVNPDEENGQELPLVDSDGQRLPFVVRVYILGAPSWVSADESPNERE